MRFSFPLKLLPYCSILITIYMTSTKLIIFSHCFKILLNNYIFGSYKTCSIYQHHVFLENLRLRTQQLIFRKQFSFSVISIRSQSGIRVKKSIRMCSSCSYHAIFIYEASFLIDFVDQQVWTRSVKWR